MHEPVTHCKEGNPFVSIPAGMSLVVAACTCLQLLVAGWVAPEGFFRSIINAAGLAIFVIVPVGAACEEFFGNFLFSDNTAPNTIYIKTKSARVWLVVSAVAALTLLGQQLTQIEKPDFFSILTTSLFVLSIFGSMLISLHILAALTIDVPNKIKPERADIGATFFISVAGALIACVSLVFNAKGTYALGGQVFILSSVSSIAILWMEHRRECIADREITPLATASLAWMAVTYFVKYYHAELSALSFAAPYFTYLAPVGLLGAYYYISQPERG